MDLEYALTLRAGTILVSPVTGVVGPGICVTKGREYVMIENAKPLYQRGELANVDLPIIDDYGRKKHPTYHEWRVRKAVRNKKQTRKHG